MSRTALDTAPAMLTRIARLDPADALSQVASVRAAVASCGVPERLDELAAALPVRVAELAPELALELAALAAALVSHAPRLPLDLEALEPVVRTAWLRVGLSSRDQSTSRATLAKLDETWLLHAIQDWSLSAAADPAALFRRMCSAQDRRLRAAVVPALGGAVADLAITPEQGFACLVALASATTGATRRAVYRALSQEWLQQLSPTSVAEREQLIRAGLADDDLELVGVCVELAASLELRGALLELFDQAEGADDLHDAKLVVALAGLGSVATREDLELALVLAVADPLRFGASAHDLVLEAHRHGVFIDDALIPSALEAFDLHRGWTAEEFVRVTHVARVALLAELRRQRGDDPRWRRRAGILAASVGTGAHELLAELLTELGNQQDVDLRVAAALLVAAGASPEYDAEAPLLMWLDRLPARVIPILRVKGGAEAAARLQALLVDPTCPEPLRDGALTAAWALSRARPTLLRELSAALGPNRSGLLDTRLRAARDELAATIYTEAAWPPDPSHRVDPRAALELLCEAGELRHLAEITRLFRIVYAHVVQLALDGDFLIKRASLPELEQQIYRYGRHLIASGRAVRRWIDAAPETGRDLVLALATDWLRERPQAPICVALLETIARQQPRGPWLRFIEPFWRHADPNVQRAAIEAILSDEGTDNGPAEGGSPGLELSLCRLTGSKDGRLVRQALAAVARFEARWAEPMVIASLRGVSMSIMQAAAEALGVVGSRRCVPALVAGLAHHENARLRELLLDALEAVAGPARAAILVDALVAEGPPRPHDRRQRMLREAISGTSSLAAALRLAGSSNPVHAALVEAALDGTITLADASQQALAEALYRAKLRPAPTKDDPTRRLRLEGFSPEAASVLAEARVGMRIWELQPVLGCVRAGLADWLAWIRPQQLAGDDRASQAAGLVLEAATDSEAQHLDGLLELALALTHQPEAEPPPPTESIAALITAFIERCVVPVSPTPAQRMRALTLLRALPPCAEVRGDRRHELLGQLGAVRTRADLDACLAACRIGPDVVGDSTRLLAEVLALPSEREDESEVYKQLRREIQAWHRSVCACPSPSAAHLPGCPDAWLLEVLQGRPLGLPVPPEPPPERRPPSDLPPSRARLEALSTALTNDDPKLRTRAAERLLAWPEARPRWADVLHAYLAGSIELGSWALRILANHLEAWPGIHADAPPDPIAHSRHAQALAERLDAIQQQRFLPVWVEAWSRGQLELAPLISTVDQSLLIPLARTQALAGEFGLVRLLVPDGSLALATLVRELAERAPDEVAHLIEEDPEPDPIDSAGEVLLDDPIRSMNLDQLVASIDEHGVEIGLAVRAVHALSDHGERAANALEQLSVDPRARVRSAALRALRKVAPRERCLATTARVLAIETRREVIPGLMKTLANGRHEPGVTAVLAYTTHRDTKLRDAAFDALAIWGREIVPTLRRVSRRARPDQRRTYELLIARLEDGAE
ncbi:hypothetical protein DB30_00707 [Enhygromyxa salina]|uniref:HEAT repeat protein n=1 Tax=Enhygromyxa salina TaxID=215803 RepID=A0A0C2DFL9_9BACT|nr:hypothetical protein [Enhygromyxa salina]KIG18422.1 hypothetical protein DB30_00707 [Enhygromyxa salina]